MDQEHKEVSRKLIRITLMSLLFMTVELVGGYLANSIAIFADAFHLLSDVLAYLISLGAVWLSTQPNPPKYLTFGWQKAQPLGALLNVAIIYVVTAQLFIEATERMLHQTVVDEPKYMLVTSLFGLGCNLVIMKILHSDPHGGHHGCSHGHAHGNQHGHQHGHEHGHKKCKGHAHEGHEHSHDNHSHENHSHENHNHNHSHTHHDHSKCKSHAPVLTISEPQSLSIPQSPQQILPHSCCSHNHNHNHQTHKMSDQLKTFSSNQQLINCSLDEHQALDSDEEISDKQDKQHKIKNINLEAAYIHILTDIILSIGVIISALTIYFFAPDHHTWSPWQLADPLCTYLFSVLAIYSTWPILKESVLLLLSASHSSSLPLQIQKLLQKMPQIKEFSQLRVWSTNRDKHYVAVKVKLNKLGSVSKVSGILTSKGVTSYIEEISEENTLLAG